MISAATVAATRKWPVALSFFAFIIIGANDGGLGVVLPSMRAHYGLDKATIGLLFLASTSGYLVAAFGSGLLAARLGQRLFLSLGAGALSAAALAVSAQPPFPALLASATLLGFGVAIIDAGLNSYIAGLPDNTALLNYLHAFYGVGALLGPAVASGSLALGMGWNSIYLVWAGAGLALLAGCLALFGGRGAAPAGEAAHGENVLLAALRLRVVWLAGVFLLVYVGAEVSLGSWGYSFLTEERHGPPLLSGWTISGYWLGLTLGRLFLARISGRLGNRRAIQLCLAGVVAGVLLTWLVPVPVAAAVGLWVVGFSLGPIFPTVIASMSQWVPGRVLPSAIGFLASLSAVGGAALPWLAGNLAEGLGLWSLLPYVVALTGVMVVLWSLLQREKAGSGNI